MSAWYDPDHPVIEAFFAKSRIRQGSKPTYRWFLRSFADVAQRHSAVDREMLDAWLKETGKRWRMSTLLNQICIVDRFLDYLTEAELITENPIDVLRCRYNVKQCKPVWRALASPNPDDALAALRRPIPFGSVLGDFMRDHVLLMRSRGYKYETQAPGCSASTDSFKAVPTWRRNHSRRCWRVGQRRSRPAITRPNARSWLGY